MDKFYSVLEQMNVYSRCFDKVKSYLLMHKGIDLVEFERRFNDRSLTLFPGNGLDDFLLGFFSSSDYCQLDRQIKNILHADIKCLCLYDLKNKK